MTVTHDNATGEWRATGRDIQRWATLVGLAVVLGSGAVSVTTWAVTAKAQMSSFERRLSELETMRDDVRATMRLVCAFVRPDQRALSGVTCPNPYVDPPERKQR